MSSPFPDPDVRALEVSARLVELIRGEIEAANGWLDFERYMELALYAPGLGYYSGGAAKFGAAGDFVTAPELSPILGRILARELKEVLTQCERPAILELGAGSGKLAESILEALDSETDLRPEYRILETSADLRDRQMSRLSSFDGRVRWLDTLDTDFEGAIVANEVMDALPVTRFSRSADTVCALGVGLAGDCFDWSEQLAGPGLSAHVESLEALVGGRFPEGYRSEFCRSLPAWISSLSDVLRRGAIWLIDYGLVEREYYHPLRTDGTLVCHYRHRAHADPFLHPGLQDISAWVDFSACARMARAESLNVAGFSTQGQFLVEGGALELLSQVGDALDLRETQALKTLVMPGEMGERFKVLLLTREVESVLPGRDLRDRL